VSKHEFDRARDPSLHWLAAGTVHDVNNLLVLVIGCAELALDDESLSPRARQLMQEIVGVGERASSLTRQFLALGRPAGAPAAAVDVAAVLASADALLRRVTGDAIQVWIDPGPTAQWVLAEASQIEQVLVKLAGNARDAMPSGGTLRSTGRDAVDRRSGGDAAGPPAQLTGSSWPTTARHRPSRAGPHVRRVLHDQAGRQGSGLGRPSSAQSSTNSAGPSGPPPPDRAPPSRSTCRRPPLQARDAAPRVEWPLTCREG
jgi:hypothetical protein